MGKVAVTQEDKATTAEILGYRDWDDATDYRLTGKQDRDRDRTLAIVVRYRIATAEACARIAEGEEYGDIEIATAIRLQQGSEKP